jgi:hypothetical protein
MMQHKYHNATLVFSADKTNTGFCQHSHRACKDFLRDVCGAGAQRMHLTASILVAVSKNLPLHWHVLTLNPWMREIGEKLCKKF